MAKIVLVDDSRFQRKRMSQLLSDLGHDVIQAENGELGLQKIEEVSPDVVITDLLMPVLDGIGLLRGLKEQNSNYPVIVVTADIQEPTKKECLELGAMAFLNKPHNINDLAAALNQVLHPQSKESTQC